MVRGGLKDFATKKNSKKTRKLLPKKKQKNETYNKNTNQTQRKKKNKNQTQAKTWKNTKGPFGPG